MASEGSDLNASAPLVLPEGLQKNSILNTQFIIKFILILYEGAVMDIITTTSTLLMLQVDSMDFPEVEEGFILNPLLSCHSNHPHGLCT